MPSSLHFSSHTSVRVLLTLTHLTRERRYPSGGGIQDVGVEEGPLYEELAAHSDDRIHVVFSTSCTYFQQWQSEVLFHS